MIFFGTEKDKSGRRTYFFGIKVYETKIRHNVKRSYLLGMRIRKKQLKTDASIAIDKIVHHTRICAAEQRILTLGLYYKDMPKEERYVLCFDYLFLPYAEAIDAWTFFQYLQSQGIPSKYVIRKENALYKKLKEENNLKDILPVGSEFQLLTNYPDIIAKSRFIICSYGFELSPFFKFLPFCKYIFIEHGVNFLKDWAVQHYTNSRFAGMIVPSRLTKEEYEKVGVDLDSLSVYYTGLPRWDRLQSQKKHDRTRNIFIFFTWRVSFGANKTLVKQYAERIQSFVYRLKKIFAGRDDIKLHISLHHALIERDIKLEESKLFEGVHFVPMSEISNMIQKTDLCITDYSSISFDFLYLNVPVIYYCFDADVEYPHQNDYIVPSIEKIKRELYNCCLSEDEAVSKVQYYAERDFSLETEYMAKNDNIFWFKGGNCERLWQLINEQ